MTTEVGTTTLSRINLSEYVGHATIFSWMFTIACCLIVGLGLALRLDLVSGWLVVMQTYSYYFRLPLSHCIASISPPVAGNFHFSASIGYCSSTRNNRVTAAPCRKSFHRRLAHALFRPISGRRRCLRQHGGRRGFSPRRE